MKRNRAALSIAGRLGLGGNNRIAAIIAVAGVTCAVTVMLLTLSITDGFKQAIRDKLSGFDADIVVQPVYNYSQGTQSHYLQITPELMQTVAGHSGGARISTALRQPGILKTADDYAALVFCAYGHGHDYAFERGNLVSGVFPDYAGNGGGDSIVISAITARRLGLEAGKRVDACFFSDDRIRLRRFTVAGIYASNFGEFDKTIAYAPMDKLQRVCGLDSSGVTAIELRGVTRDSIPERAESLQTEFLRRAQMTDADSVPVVDNITRSGAIYLNWLDLLDTNVVVIFVLMCCVAACTLVSSLFILILNNIPAIGVLRALGARRGMVRDIFVIMAMRLVGAGLVLGNVLALAVILLQSTLHCFPLDPEMYYLDSVPTAWSWGGFVLTDLGVIVLSWLTLVLPARLASSISPARTMRYE